MKLSKIILGLIAMLVFVTTISCDKEEVSQLSITGTVQYTETDLVADEITIKLTIYDIEDPFRGNPNNVVLIDEVTTDEFGRYKFSFDRSVLPKNASYMLSAVGFFITGQITPCLQLGSAGGGFSLSNTIIRDLKIDQRTFLEITFDKLDHLTNDRVMLSRPSCPLAFFETTLEKADTTIIETLIFQEFKTVDIEYSILKDNGIFEYTISDVVLLKNDTTRLTIEY